MKKNIILLTFLLLSSTMFAQKAELTSAILSFRKQDMESAKTYIDAAEVKLNDGGNLKAKDLGKFWHNKGLVYLSLYKEDSLDISLLDISSSAFKTSAELVGHPLISKSLLYLNADCINLYNEFAFKNYNEFHYLKK